MRVSLGAPLGRIARLNNPEMFREYENVIVFTREDIRRRYKTITREMAYINKIGLNLDKNDEWKLIGYWPTIMQVVSRIDMNMDLIFKREPLQSYLDAYIYNNIQDQKNISLSPQKALNTGKLSKLNDWVE